MPWWSRSRKKCLNRASGFPLAPSMAPTFGVGPSPSSQWSLATLTDTTVCFTGLLGGSHARQVDEPNWDEVIRAIQDTVKRIE